MTEPLFHDGPEIQDPRAEFVRIGERLGRSLTGKGSAHAMSTWVSAIATWGRVGGLPARYQDFKRGHWEALLSAAMAYEATKRHAEGGEGPQDQGMDAPPAVAEAPWQHGDSFRATHTETVDDYTPAGLMSRPNGLERRAPEMESVRGGGVPAQLMRLFEQALDKGASIGELVELTERIQKRNAELEFARDFSDFQANAPAIPRTSTARINTKSGTTFEFTYADFEQIVSTVRPDLSARGFSFTFDSKTDGRMLTCTCTLRHRNGHHVSASFALPTESSSAMNEQQKVGAALNYAKRQSLIAVLGLTMTDPEAEEGTVSEPITDHEVANITALVAETGVQVDKFLKHFAIATIAEMRRSQYPEAVRLLEARRKAGAK